MSFVRLVVGDKSGRVLDELAADVKMVNWRLNKVGKAKFSIAAVDPKATSTNLKYGNKIFMEFENGLPDWGGVIDPPMIWDRDLITVEAYSGEYLFKYRITDKGRYFSNETVGEIYESLIDETNAVQDTGVAPDTALFKGGPTHSPDYHFKSLLTIFQESLTGRLSTYDFEIVPRLVGGNIAFTAKLYQSKGSDKSNLALIQDKNLGLIKLKEQGPIINSWDMAGEGTDWGPSRLTSPAFDQTSFDDYGLRQWSAIFGDVKEQATLDNHADTALEKSKSPTNIFTLTALDENPVGYSGYGVGDIINLVAPSYGFGGTDTLVRLLSREFAPRTGHCTLIVQEQV